MLNLRISPEKLVLVLLLWSFVVLKHEKEEVWGRNCEEGPKLVSGGRIFD